MWLRKTVDEKIKFEDLYVSFDETLSDYVVRAPWDPTSYVTYVGDLQLGYGAPWLLYKVLEKTKQKYPEGVFKHDLRTKPIPQLTDPVVRRQGKRTRKYKDGDYESKIDEQRKRFWLRPTIPYGWTYTFGDENTSKNVNRVEDRWWYGGAY